MTQSMTVLPSFLWAFFALGIVWLVLGLSSSWNPLKLAEGADGRYSTSKFQWLLWTVVVLFAYVLAIATRSRDGIFEAVLEIPRNVLYAMGFTVTTMATAKGVKVGYINSGRLAPTTAPKARLRDLVTDDAGVPDLSKVQMLLWTTLAAVLFLFRTYEAVKMYSTGDNDLSTLPDIDTTLMALMGLGQGGYLGKKIASSDTPAIPPATLAPMNFVRGTRPAATGVLADHACVPAAEAHVIVRKCAGAPFDIDTKLSDVFTDNKREQFCQCVSDESGVPRAHVACAPSSTFGNVIDSISC